MNPIETHRVSRCGLLCLIAGVLVVLSAGCSGGTKQNEQKETVSADQISPEEIELGGVRLFKGDGEQGFRIEGQVQNNSPKMTLTEMDVKVVMQDCLDTGVCEILAEEVAKVPTNVAAGQTSAFQSADILKDMPAPKGTLGWHYAVVAAK